MYGLQVDADRPLKRVRFSFFKFFSPNLFSLCFCWFGSWLLTISVSTPWRGVPMENKLPAAAMTKPSRFGTRDLEIASRPWPATRASTFFFNVFHLCLCWFLCFFLTVSVDSRDDFSQLQGDVSGMEQGWQASQRQRWHDGEDLVSGLDWRFWVRVDADRAFGRVSFAPKFVLLVSVDSCTDFSKKQCQLGGVESRWKANCQRQLWQNH